MSINNVGHPEMMPHHWHTINSTLEFEEEHETLSNEIMILLFLMGCASWFSTCANKWCKITQRQRKQLSIPVEDNKTYFDDDQSKKEPKVEGIKYVIIKNKSIPLLNQQAVPLLIGMIFAIN